MTKFICIKCSNKKAPCAFIINNDDIMAPEYCPTMGDRAAWKREKPTRVFTACELCGQPLSMCKC